MILHGNNIDLMRDLDSNSIDAIVTDAPYGLGKEPDATAMLHAWVTKGHLEVKGGGFMGKEWDSFVPQPQFWKEAFRVLKPGGHVVCFFGTRTYDWGVMAMRLAGFEIRDMVSWVFGSGFPKSLNISKAIDKEAGLDRESGYIPVKRNQIFGDGKGKQAGIDRTPGVNLSGIPASTESEYYDGWGTALKPAVEPIVLARKPIEKGLTVAQNTLKYGTGGLNIDACRVGSEGGTKKVNTNECYDGNGIYGNGLSGGVCNEINKGRFPANLIHDGSEEAIGGFPMTSSGKPGLSGYNRKGTIGGNGTYCGGVGMPTYNHGDEGSASRYFYCAKASQAERNVGMSHFSETEMGRNQSSLDGGAMLTGSGNPRSNAKKNFHPTVKPVALMAWLVRLVTPIDGICLDPFAGSGTTGMACELQGYKYILMEMTDEYIPIIEARIQACKDGLIKLDHEKRKTKVSKPKPKDNNQQTLF